jgi:hypothetical protein
MFPLFIVLSLIQTPTGGMSVPQEELVTWQRCKETIGDVEALVEGLLGQFKLCNHTCSGALRETDVTRHCAVVIAAEATGVTQETTDDGLVRIRPSSYALTSTCASTALWSLALPCKLASRLLLMLLLLRMVVMVLMTVSPCILLQKQRCLQLGDYLCRNRQFNQYVEAALEKRMSQADKERRRKACTSAAGGSGTDEQRSKQMREARKRLPLGFMLPAVQGGQGELAETVGSHTFLWWSNAFILVQEQQQQQQRSTCVAADSFNGMSKAAARQLVTSGRCYPSDRMARCDGAQSFMCELACTRSSIHVRKLCRGQYTQQQQ